MFMKKRQHAQVMARVHGSGECMEQLQIDSGYSSDIDSDSGRDLDQSQYFFGGSEFLKVQAHFKFFFDKENLLVMEEVVVPNQPGSFRSESMFDKRNQTSHQMGNHEYNDVRYAQKRPSVIRHTQMIDNLHSHEMNYLCHKNIGIDFQTSKNVLPNSNTCHYRQRRNSNTSLESSYLKSCPILMNPNTKYKKTEMTVFDSGHCSIHPCESPIHETVTAKSQNTLQISSFRSNQLLINFDLRDNSAKSNSKHCYRDHLLVHMGTVIRHILKCPT